MKRSTTVISVLVFFITVLTTGLFGAREKTEVIGKVSWYTEQNTFTEIVDIATKENRPILTVFSAAWCVPCQDIKKLVFVGDDFQKVADQVVLLYIEQTDPKAKDYLLKNKISGYPTFKIFSSEGVELENNYPERTVDGFLEWIKEVKAGNNYYELSRRMEKEPLNRELIFKFADKIRFSRYAEQVELLRRGIRLNPDYNDPFTQEAYEKLLPALCRMMMDIYDKEDRQKFARDNNGEFMGIMNAYYPDKFKYRLKGDSVYLYVFNWYNDMGDHRQNLVYFADFLKSRGNKIENAKDAGLFPEIISSLLRTNREKEAEEWLSKLQALLKKEMDTAAGPNAEIDNQYNSYALGNLYREFIDYYGEKGLIKKAEEYARLYIDHLTAMRMSLFANYNKIRWAKEYLLFAEELVKELETKSKTAAGEKRADAIRDLAAIYARMGKTALAKKYLYDLHEDQTALESLNDKQKADFYDNIASTMVSAKIVEPKTLEIVEKALKLSESPGIMHTLASTYAELGNFTKALEIEAKVLGSADLDERFRPMYSQKAEKWKKAASKQPPVKK